MTDLAAEGDRLYADPTPYGVSRFNEWAHENWPAIAAALRERNAYKEHADLWAEKAIQAQEKVDALRARAETAEAKAARLEWAMRHGEGTVRVALRELDAAHAAAVEARLAGNPQPPARSHSTGTSGFTTWRPDR